MTQLFVAGPPVVQHATHEKLTKEELGGFSVHGSNGSLDNWAGSEAVAMEQLRTFLGFLPSSSWELPPRSLAHSQKDQPDRQDKFLLDAIPRHRQEAYDVRAIIHAIVDRDINTPSTASSASPSTSPSSSFFEIGAEWGGSVVVGMARLDGWSVGVLSSDCRVLGGQLDARACDKARRFVELCANFHVPLVNLVDQPGFCVGLAGETAGTIRKGAQLMATLYGLTLPTFTVILRRAFGVAGAAFADQKRSQFAQMRVAWPSGDWGSLPLEGQFPAT
jgi:acetyl-CoA carboxylase carboxyltransferase component